MCLSVDQQRNQVKTHAKAALDTTSDAALQAALESWLQDGDDGDKTRAVSDAPDRRPEPDRRLRRRRAVRGTTPTSW